MKSDIGRIDMLVIMVIAFLLVFVGLDLLASRAGTSGHSMSGTGWMVQMKQPIIRAYNGVTRPWRGVPTPALGQDQPDVYPQFGGIGGSAPTTPEFVAPYASFQG